MKKLIKLFINSAIISSMLLSSVSVFASTSKRVVKISTGSQIANVNGENITLSIAPYVQKPSNSMMIPLRFVSTALGINENNIQYMPTTKEIIITNNDTNVKFIVGSSELVINGESFDMAMKDDDTGKLDYIYTEVKNGSTFIPLRSLESAFSVKIDWINETKTAVLTNEIENTTTNIQVEEQPIIEDVNTSLNNNNQQENIIVSSEKELTEEEIRALEEEVVKLVNEERAKYGLEPLQIDEDLMKSARAKSEDMATRDYYDHIDPDGYFIYKDYAKAENIGARTTPKEAVESWLNSKGHSDNILNPNYKYIGVGLAYGKATWWYNDNNIHPYWTQHFN